MFRAIDTANGCSTIEDPEWRETEECLLYVEGAFLKPEAIVEKLRALAAFTRRSIVGLIPSHSTPQGRRYWARVDISKMNRSKRVQTNLVQLNASANCVSNYVQTLRPQAVIGYSQGANVVLRAQMSSPQSFPPIIAICPGVIEGLTYEKTTDVSLIGATEDQFIDEALRKVLVGMLGVHEYVLHGHTHDWSETMAKAAADMFRGISTH